MECSMTDRMTRLLALIDVVDRELAGRPEVFTSPLGFGLGTLLSVARSDPELVFDAIVTGSIMLDGLSLYLSGELSLDEVLALVSTHLQPRIGIVIMADGQA
jgi:hypothetical protein